MKGRVIILDHVDGREAAALLADGRLRDVLIDPVDESTPRPGAIYRGRVGRPMKGQGGAFVELGADQRGYLRQAKGLSPGTALLVQVGAVAEAGKAPPVLTRLLFRSRYVIVSPRAPGLNVSRSIRDDALRDHLLELAHDAVAETDLTDDTGLILRSACMDGEEGDIAEDITATTALAAAVLADAEGDPELLVDAPSAHLAAWRDWAVPMADAVVTETGGFEAHGVFEATEAALAPDLPLGGGAAARIEATRAFVAVDVNTGADTSAAAGLKANLGLARELPSALRLRGLGGIVILDLAPFPKKERRRFEDALRREMRLAGLEAVLAGWTPLGHYEIQLRRDRLPLRIHWPG